MPALFPFGFICRPEFVNLSPPTVAQITGDFRGRDNWFSAELPHILKELMLFFKSSKEQ